MKKKNIAFIIALFALAACNRGGEMTPTEYVEYDRNTVVFYQDDGASSASVPCDNNGTSMIKYSAPNDSDLVLETAHHVIQIQGTPNKPYAYYVWAGGKDYSEDPDLIVEDGAAAILVEE